MDLLQIVTATSLTPQEVATRTARIHAAVLSKSRYLDAPNFTVIHPADLEILFEEYDQSFFGGAVRRAVGQSPLEFGLSRRMTSSGGKTASYQHRLTGSRKYAISAATTLLFGCFTENDHRPIVASGIVCRDRLEALQRVMEHELVHLIEILLWDESSCSQSRFHSITLRFFAHTENKHKLITPRERASVQFGIRPGTKVRFRFDGVEKFGIVNRISKRATVLVEDSGGTRYSNGKHYAKFYVPVQSLEPVE